MFRRYVSATLIVLAAALASAAQTSPSGPAAQPSSIASTSTKTTVFRPTKDQVRQGQTILKEQKLYTGQATGLYNDDTRAAIRAFQKANGLDINGKFDPPTLKKMNVSMSAPAAKTTLASTGSATKVSSSTVAGAKRPPPFQATDEQIKSLQQKLKDAKIFDGDIDARRSTALTNAIKKYQSDNGLNPTGGINAATLEKMGIPLTDKQKSYMPAPAAPKK